MGDLVVITGTHSPAGEVDRAVRAVTWDTQATVGAQGRHLIMGEGVEKASWRRWHFNLTVWIGARLPG